MTANPKQIYDVPINPDKEKIILNMALHAAFVLTFQQMGLMFFGDRLVIDKQIGYVLKSRNFLGEIPNALEVFF